MIYIIENEIKFNTHDYTLENIPSSEFIKLALPAGRLLELIIKSNGEVLSRERLLTEIWDNYGLRGSNNNLSQYLSALRKNLADFGCNDFIITIPKVGVFLNKSISIRSECDNSEPDCIPLKKKTSKNKVLLTLLVCAASVVILFLLYIYYTKSNNGFYAGNGVIAYERIVDNSCYVVFSKDYSGAELTLLSKEIKKILAENNLTCNDSSIIHFEHYTTVSTNSLGKTLLSYCNIGFKKEVISCMNFFYYDREKTDV